MSISIINEQLSMINLWIQAPLNYQLLMNNYRLITDNCLLTSESPPMAISATGVNLDGYITLKVSPIKYNPKKSATSFFKRQAQY